MQIEEAIKRCNRRIRELKLHFAIDNLDLEAIKILLEYVETMQKEFDRLEGIEDNTSMLKYELNEKDKIIDLIADELRYQKGMGQDDIFCYDMCENDEGVVVCDRKNCKEHIKEYFYKRASEEDVTDGR